MAKFNLRKELTTVLLAECLTITAAAREKGDKSSKKDKYTALQEVLAKKRDYDVSERFALFIRDAIGAALNDLATVQALVIDSSSKGKLTKYQPITVIRTTVSYNVAPGLFILLHGKRMLVMSKDGVEHGIGDADGPMLATDAEVQQCILDLTPGAFKYILTSDHFASVVAQVIGDDEEEEETVPPVEPTKS